MTTKVLLGLLGVVLACHPMPGVETDALPSKDPVALPGGPLQLAATGRVLDTALLADDAGFVGVWSQVATNGVWSLHTQRLSTQAVAVGPVSLLWELNAPEKDWPRFGPADLVAGVGLGLLLRQAGPPSYTAHVIRFTAAGVVVERHRHGYWAGKGAALVARPNGLHLLLGREEGLATLALESLPLVEPVLPWEGQVQAAVVGDGLAVVTRTGFGHGTATYALVLDADVPARRQDLPLLAWDEGVIFFDSVLRLLWDGTAYLVVWQSLDGVTLWVTRVAGPLGARTATRTQLADAQAQYELVGDAAVHGGVVSAAWASALGQHDEHVVLQNGPRGAACGVQQAAGLAAQDVPAVAMAAHASGVLGVLWADARGLEQQRGDGQDNRLFFRGVDPSVCAGRN